MQAHDPGTANGSTLEPMVRTLEYRTELAREDRAALLALPFTHRLVERHHYVVRDGALATHACVLLSGYAVRSKIVASGHRQILAIHIKGDLVDLQNSLLKVADHSVEMLTAGRIGMIPRDEIKRITFERPVVATAMWRETLVDAAIFREWITNVGRRDARTRIAHLLCEFALRLKVAGMGKDTEYELPMTQEQIADATGLTPIHVNRTMKALERDGLIARIQPRAIRIGDWRKLADTGDFQSHYLHLHHDEPALA